MSHPAFVGYDCAVMIHKVEFQNFKGLRQVSLDLDRLTVLVGPNASGKTTVLEGLDYLILTSSENVRKALPSVRALQMLRSSGAEGEMSLICFGDTAWVRLAEDPDDTFEPPAGYEHGEGKEVQEYGPKDGPGTIEKSYGGALMSNRWALGPAAFLRLDMKRLVAPSYSDEAVPAMQRDGEGLAPVLAYMASNQPDDYEGIEEALRDVVPIVRRMRFPRARVVRTESEVIKVDDKTFTRSAEREYWGNSIEFDMQGAAGIPAHMVSEGTLLVLGILTVLMGPNRPKVALLDDMDRALHPKAQGDLVGLLRKLLDQNPEMQIVATSHSPYLLDHLRPEEVRLTTLTDDGSVICGRLDEHPEFEKWKETMAPGEFWSLVGEKWLVEAKAGEQG